MTGPAGRGSTWNREDIARAVGVPACLALAGCAAALLVIDSSLWPSLPAMAIWFAGALVLHDLVLFPAAAATDRLLARLPATPVPLVNHVRVPLLGAALTGLVFLPGLIRQGEPAHLGATGLDQEPYLASWLLLVLAMAAVSALVWAVRTVRAR